MKASHSTSLWPYRGSKAFLVTSLNSWLNWLATSRRSWITSRRYPKAYINWSRTMPREYARPMQSYARQDSKKSSRHHHLEARCPGTHRIVRSFLCNNSRWKQRSRNSKEESTTTTGTRPCRRLSLLLPKTDLCQQSIWACIPSLRLVCEPTSKSCLAIPVIFLQESYTWKWLETKITPKSILSSLARFSWNSLSISKTDETELSLICLIWREKELSIYSLCCSCIITWIRILSLVKRSWDSSESISKRTCCCLMDSGDKSLSISQLTTSLFHMQSSSMSSSIGSSGSMFQQSRRQERRWQDQPLLGWVAKPQSQMFSLQTAEHQLHLQHVVHLK